MLLSDEITLTLDRSNHSDKLRCFKYKLIIHNSNETEALISLVFKRNLCRYKQDYSAIEYQQVKIPHELTAKEWITTMVLKEDSLLNDIDENKGLDIDEKRSLLEIKEKLELINQQIKIREF